MRELHLHYQFTTIDQFYRRLDSLPGTGTSASAKLFQTFSHRHFSARGPINFIKILCRMLPLKKFWFNRQRSLKRMLDYTYFDFASDLLENEKEYRWLYETFADEESRKTLIQVMLYKITLDRNFLHSCARHSIDQYYDPEIFSFGQNEVIADCGGFNGDSALLFFRLFGNCRRYYLFEPDPANLDFARRTLKAFSNIEFRQNSTGACNGLHSFSEKGPSGRIKADGRIKTAMVRLDDAVSEPITLIKADVEGNETATLDGACNQIRQHRPRLAICAYHRPDDAWKIARRIRELVPDYRLRFRLYQSAYCETVIYAD